MGGNSNIAESSGSGTSAECTAQMESATNLGWLANIEMQLQKELNSAAQELQAFLPGTPEGDRFDNAADIVRMAIKGDPDAQDLVKEAMQQGGSMSAQLALLPLSFAFGFPGYAAGVAAMAGLNPDIRGELLQGDLRGAGMAALHLGQNVAWGMNSHYVPYDSAAKNASVDEKLTPTGKVVILTIWPVVYDIAERVNMLYHSLHQTFAEPSECEK